MGARRGLRVDHVLPHVPVRQRVLTLPHRLRYLLAWNHKLCRAVLGVAVRAVLGFYRHRARRAGVRDGRSGAVTVIQRFGGGLQLNVHFHTLLLDGVFAQGEDGSLEFHAAEPPSDEEVARLLATIYRRVQRLLARRGLDVDDAPDVDPLAEESPALAGISSASIQGRIALGPRAGARANPPEKPRDWKWADLMRRVSDLDVLACPRCGGRMSVIATIEAADVLHKILGHLGLPTDPPAPLPARSPPGAHDLFPDSPA